MSNIVESGSKCYSSRGRKAASYDGSSSIIDVRVFRIDVARGNAKLWSSMGCSVYLLGL
jgi:hypothetical protein